ncbi:glycosyltransferase family 2 protein [Anianabacter salinae]|uniref:glycosyltransferase family 2 protein n=1 Tax=Anianabacter salinae TaxID=2851023 RepID=UPI00225E3E0D|nr:glycosyltransferase family 2 protein [Anianabacter salinae]MBV0911495.1 glycosyltransferase family 2 protein [Anianabacter salinae]
MDYSRKRLTPLDLGVGIHLDSVIAAPGATTARIVLGTGFPPHALAEVPETRIRSTRAINGGLVLDVDTDLRGGALRLPVNEEVWVQPSIAEPHLFEGLNVGLAVRTGEPPEIVLDWLRWHARVHRMQAALIIDRLAGADGPGLDLALARADIEGLQKVVLLFPGMATGHPDLGPESDPYYAPDAPGKDRMTEPPPERWTAPFAEFTLFEHLRTRYLGQARAVMNVDVTDLVAPIEGTTIFDRAVASRGGMTQLVARRVYPWGLRKDDAAGFGDHICRRFDGQPSNPRWCIAPAKLPETSVLRLIRVVGAEPDGTPQLYWRCMALRHPGQKVSAIVPKTSLVEDTRLIEVMTEAFGADPVRAPAETLKPMKKIERGRTGIVTTMKNEGPFILEWLAYHRSIGVEDFLVYTNDCNDGTDTMLQLLQDKGYVQHRDNPFKGTDLKPQHAALQAAETEPMVKALDWTVCMDVDEFITIHVGDGTLNDLYDAVPDANLISMNWRLFGNADVHGFEDRFITEQFTLCAPEFCNKPHQAWGFKTLARNVGIFKKLGVHRPKGLKPQLVGEVNWVNGSGKPLPQDMWRNAWRTNADTYGYDLVTLNHYAVRSAESFLVKRDRGRVNHVDRDQGLAYWFRMNHNAVEDLSIQKRLPRAQEELARMLADPEIAAAHAHSVACHRAKIDALKATENYAAFYAELTGPRMEKLSKMLRHFGAGVFLAGPEVIPDHVWQDDLPEEFFFTVQHKAQVH